MADHSHGFSVSARVAAACLPAALVALFEVLANLPVSFTHGLLPAPMLALAPIYFWVLVRPDLMSPPVVMCLGLLEDLFSGGAPGIWAASFLAAYTLTDRQRDAFAGLAGIGAILGFAAVMFTAAGSAYVLGGIAYWSLPPLAPLLISSTVTVVLYPPAAIFMGWLHRHIVGPQRSDI